MIPKSEPEGNLKIHSFSTRQLNNEAFFSAKGARRLLAERGVIDLTGTLDPDLLAAAGRIMQMMKFRVKRGEPFLWIVEQTEQPVPDTLLCFPLVSPSFPREMWRERLTFFGAISDLVKLRPFFFEEKLPFFSCVVGHTTVRDRISVASVLRRGGFLVECSSNIAEDALFSSKANDQITDADNLFLSDIGSSIPGGAHVLFRSELSLGALHGIHPATIACSLAEIAPFYKNQGVLDLTGDTLDPAHLHVFGEIMKGVAEEHGSIFLVIGESLNAGTRAYCRFANPQWFFLDPAMDGSSTWRYGRCLLRGTVEDLAKLTPYFVSGELPRFRYILDDICALSGGKFTDFVYRSCSIMEDLLTLHSALEEGGVLAVAACTFLHEREERRICRGDQAVTVEIGLSEEGLASLANLFDMKVIEDAWRIRLSIQEANAYLRTLNDRRIPESGEVSPPPREPTSPGILPHDVELLLPVRTGWLSMPGLVDPHARLFFGIDAKDSETIFIFCPQSPMISLTSLPPERFVPPILEQWQPLPGESLREGMGDVLALRRAFREASKSSPEADLRKLSVTFEDHARPLRPDSFVFCVKKASEGLGE
ncbi:MAG: hypothetical protein LBJ70_03815 [Holosporales bacterium]|jgi:hypothetical protein|nr:hypothetical protein [Holosporales bacterium]